MSTVVDVPEYLDGCELTAAEDLAREPAFWLAHPLLTKGDPGERPEEHGVDASAYEAMVDRLSDCELPWPVLRIGIGGGHTVLVVYANDEEADNVDFFVRHPLGAARVPRPVRCRRCRARPVLDGARRPRRERTERPGRRRGPERPVPAPAAPAARARGLRPMRPKPGTPWRGPCPASGYAATRPPRWPRPCCPGRDGPTDPGGTSRTPARSPCVPPRTAPAGSRSPSGRDHPGTGARPGRPLTRPRRLTCGSSRSGSRSAGCTRRPPRSDRSRSPARPSPGFACTTGGPFRPGARRA